MSLSAFRQSLARPDFAQRSCTPIAASPGWNEYDTDLVATASRELNLEIRPWFELDDYQDDPRYAQLIATQRAQVDTFREDGYLILEETEIAHATLDAVIHALDGLDPSSEYIHGGRTQDAWNRFPAVGDIATAARILETLQMLYQRDPIPFQTLNFRVATQQRAHSDTIHFNTLP